MKNNKKLLSFLLTCCLAITFLIPSFAAFGAEHDKGRKVVVIVMDYVDVSDLIYANTPNLDKLINHSATGLMNIRAKNLNPSSSYMSIAAGIKIGTVPNAELSFNSNEDIAVLPYVFQSQNATAKARDLYSVFTGETPNDEGVVNIYIEMLKNTALKYKPSYEPGQIGKTARENGLKTAVIGNGDTVSTLNRNIALLAMDEKGMIPLGNVSQDLLEVNPTVLGGMQTNHQTMLSYIKQYLPQSDILFIDFGDTTRIEMDGINAASHIIQKQRKQALERNDKLLGEIMSLVDLEKTMLIIMTPNSHKQMAEEGNIGLTPVIVYYPDSKKGLLTSPTTRREGIVASADIMPSIFAYLNSEAGFKNQEMQVINKENSLIYLKEKIDFFKNLRTSRLPLNITFMIFALIVILWGHIIISTKKKTLYPYLDKIIFASLCIPVIFLFISFTNYESIFISIITTLVLSILSAIFILKLWPDPFKALFSLTLITAVLLIIDILSGSPLMLNSPLGSDAIAGGRFYGIGNDYMGILLASAVTATALGISTFKTKNTFKITLASIPLLIAALTIGYPKWGANVGGFITALFTWGVFILIMTQNKLNFKKIIIIGILSVLAVIAVASIDAFINPNPSHAGKAVKSLLAGGGQTFLAIIRIKLGIVSNTVSSSVWTLVLLLELVLLALWKIKKNDVLALIRAEYPYMSKALNILAVAAATVFLVNDTGVIAASFILLYMFSLMWLSLKNCQI